MAVPTAGHPSSTARISRVPITQSAYACPSASTSHTCSGRRSTSVLTTATTGVCPVRRPLNRPGASGARSWPPSDRPSCAGRRSAAAAAPDALRTPPRCRGAAGRRRPDQKGVKNGAGGVGIASRPWRPRSTPEPHGAMTAALLQLTGFLGTAWVVYRFVDWSYRRGPREPAEGLRPDGTVTRRWAPRGPIEDDHGRRGPRNAPHLPGRRPWRREDLRHARRGAPAGVARHGRRGGGRRNPRPAAHR